MADGASECVVFFEIGDDRRAFKDHLGTCHYQSFDRQSAHLVKSKSVSWRLLVMANDHGKTVAAEATRRHRASS